MYVLYAAAQRARMVISTQQSVTLDSNIEESSDLVLPVQPHACCRLTC
jgi:hypothetical protein